MIMRWLRRSEPALSALVAALDRDEQVMGLTPTEDGMTLAASRFGLWLVDGDRAERWDWHLISKARLADGVLGLTLADEVDRWEDGTVVLVDRPEVQIRPERLTRLTDTVHHRVRRSVAASRHLPWPGAGCWVVLRRIAGRDGLAVQLRLDAGADASADEFAAAVGLVVDELWPEGAVRIGAPGPE
jgi:hypothetical protein